MINIFLIKYSHELLFTQKVPAVHYFLSLQRFKIHLHGANAKVYFDVLRISFRLRLV